MDTENRRLLDVLDRHLQDRQKGPALEAMRQLFARLETVAYDFGYGAATVVFRTSEGRRMLSELIRENWWENRVRIPAAIARSFPVSLRSISNGVCYRVNPRCFVDEQPVLAYCDDVGSLVDNLRGLREVGRARFTAEPFMALECERECALLALDPTFTGEVSFRSRGVGEFCTEVYHARRDGTYVAIERDDFCLK